MDLYRDARDFPATLTGGGKLLTPARIARTGVSFTTVRWHTDKGRLVRPHQGVYIIGPRSPDLLDRIRAALAVCPQGTVVGFHTAAALLGFGVPEDDAIHVVVPAGGVVPNRRGLRTHESVVPVAATRRLGIPCAPAARTAIDLARTLRRGVALAVLDAALFARACTPTELATELARHEGLRGIRQARDLVLLSDGRAECRQESELRLILHDGGLRGFEPQVEVFDSAPYPLFRLDLAHRGSRVAAEYDGVSHTRSRLRSDRRRHNRLSELGWDIRYFTDANLYGAPSGIVPTLARALHTRAIMEKSLETEIIL